MGMDQMYVDFIEFPERNADTKSPRLQNQIYLHGIKFEWMFSQRDFTNARPQMVHMALVQEKELDYVTASIPTNEKVFSGFWKDDFTESGVLDWTEYSPTDVYSRDTNYNRLNPDKWNVIFHKKRILNPPGSTSWVKGNTWMTNINTYVRVNKMIEFIGANASQPTRRIYVLYWTYPLDASDYESLKTNAVLQNVSQQGETRVYWSNPN